MDKEYVPHFWFEKAICIEADKVSTGYGFRWPNTIPEWGTFLWNADIFFGEVPFCKGLALAVLTINILILL